MLIGEQALLPNGAAPIERLDPLDRHDVLVTVRPGGRMSVSSSEGEVGHLARLSVHAENRLIKRGGWTGDGADRHISGLGQVDEDPAADRQRPEGTAVPFATTGGDEAVAAGVVPGPDT